MEALPTTAGIYRIVHMDSGDEYIGSTRNLRARWNSHKRYMRKGEHSKIMQAVHDEFGIDSLVFEIIEHVDVPKALSRSEATAILLPIEQSWLDKRQPVLNTLKLAGKPFGYKHSEESIAKIVAAHTGMKRTPEARANMSAAQRRRYEDPAEREKIAVTRRGRKASEEARANMRASSQKGKKKPPEFSENLSRKLMGHPVSQETRDKIGAANKAIRARKKLEAEQQKAQEGLNGNPDPECEATA